MLAHPADAQAPAQNIVIPSGSIASALAAIARQGHVTIGYIGHVPSIALEASSAPNVAEALARIARKAGLRVHQITPVRYRLERVASPASQRHTVPSHSDDMIAPSAEILVTGTKREAALSSLPLSVFIERADDIPTLAGLPGTQSALLNASSVTSTNMGPGRNRIFIRGVADSPFNGPTQSTVGLFLNDARLNFDTPDPDLRTVDLDRVEVLKGPQGALYGSGVLGGVYRVVPRAPEFGSSGGAASAQISSTAHGGMGQAATGVLNIPLGDRLAVRGVGYAEHGAGWIDDSLRLQNNINSVRTFGGRLAARWAPGAVTLDTLLAGQWTRAHDSQYASADLGPYTRATIFPEPQRTDFASAQAKLAFPIRSVQASVTSAYVRHQIANQFDASQATSTFGLSGPALYQDTRHQTVLTNEARLQDDQGRFQWLMGLYHLTARSSVAWTVTDANAQLPYLYEKSYQDYAVFGDASLALGRSFRLHTGLRLSRAINEERHSQAGDVEHDGAWRTNPSAALLWRPNSDAQVWLGYATATRPGGLNPSATKEPFNFGADKLQSLELGFRLKPIDSHVALEGSVYRINWSNIQSDILLSSGLLGTFNIGRAHNVGAEMLARWTRGRGLIEAAGAMQFGDVYSQSTIIGPVKDGRLPTIPRLRGHVRFEMPGPFFLPETLFGVALHASGPSHLSFDPRLDRKTSSFAILSAYSRYDGRLFTLSLSCDNLLDSKADSFAFGNPFSVQTIQQRTPVRPRSLALTVARRF